MRTRHVNVYFRTFREPDEPCLFRRLSEMIQKRSPGIVNEVRRNLFRVTVRFPGMRRIAARPKTTECGPCDGPWPKASRSSNCRASSHLDPKRIKNP